MATGSAGAIVKEYSGAVREALSDSSFSITFPDDADLLSKAMLVCATFAIDFVFFGKKTFGEVCSIYFFDGLGTWN